MNRRSLMSGMLLGSLLLLLVGCPEGDAPKLTVSPKTQTVVAGGAPVNFTATLTGASGTITWSLSGPGSLSTTTGANTTYTPPASVASPQTATLTATSGSLSDSATITVNPPASITVLGKVVGDHGQGAGGFYVIIGSTTVFTAADGSFSIPNVTPPYDAVVFESGTKVVYYYKGLTRPDPTLMAIELGTAYLKSASFSGNLSGGAGFPNPPNHTTHVFFGSPETLRSDKTVTGPAYGLVYPVWSGPDSTSGSVYALQWQFDPNTSLPIDYKGFGSRPLTLSKGGTFNNQNVTLSSSVAEDTLSGSVSVPAGYALEVRKVNLRVAPGSGTELLRDTSAAASFSYVTPRIAGATVSLVARAISGGKLSVAWKANLATNATGVSLSLPAAPGLTVPVNNATGVTTSTVFQTTGFSGGVNVFHFFDTAGDKNKPDFYVITTANTTTIPDLSAIGLGLPSGANYAWRVLVVAPFTTTDAAAGPGGLLRDYTMAALLIGAVPNADGSYGKSEVFTFTTP